jgi:co-chaperonin GroES (HSP10)
MTFKPFGKNILFQPKEKEKVIGDTSKFLLYGTVLDIGAEVKNIKVGDIIGYTQWGLNKIVMEDKSENFFISESDDFILGVYETPIL